MKKQRTRKLALAASFCFAAFTIGCGVPAPELDGKSQSLRLSQASPAVQAGLMKKARSQQVPLNLKETLKKSLSQSVMDSLKNSTKNQITPGQPLQPKPELDWDHRVLHAAVDRPIELMLHVPQGTTLLSEGSTPHQLQSSQTYGSAEMLEVHITLEKRLLEPGTLEVKLRVERDGHEYLLSFEVQVP